MERNLGEVEFLHRGAVPFALAACEKFELLPVSGHYDEKEQVWQGADIAAALTFTLTATPGDNDSDQD